MKRNILLTITVAVILAWAGSSRAVVIEDFEDVSDWMAGAGPGASGSISTSAAEAQEGSFAGALNYAHGSASYDYIYFSKNLSSSPVDLGDPNVMAVVVDMKMPNDPDMFIQIRLSDAQGRFIEHYFADEGDGLWHRVVLPLSDPLVWADYGNHPNIHAITQLRIETNGNGSTTPTSGVVYVDHLRVEQPDPAVIEGFEGEINWYVGVGPAAQGGSITLDASEAQVGRYAGAFHYELSTATGNDFIDFGMNFSADPRDLSAADSLDLRIKMPNDPDMFLQVHLLGAAGGFLEYVFAEGDGQWHDLSLSFADDFVDYDDPPDLSAISIIRFRALGDVSATATSNTFYVDQIVAGDPVLVCEGLKHDVDGNCVINLLDFAGFAGEWLKCGWVFCE